jgi:hypothetical protein
MSVKNVKRIDTGRTHGWQVCIQRDGEETTKLFSDKKYGGRDVALNKAKAHRDALLVKMPNLPEGPNAQLHTDRARQKAWQKLTKTGVKGISLNWVPVSDGFIPQACAMWGDPKSGQRKRRARSVREHGLDHALEVCCKLLYEGRGETGPTPEALYERAHPVFEELIEARRTAEEAQAEARQRSMAAKKRALEQAT